VSPSAIPSLDGIDDVRALRRRLRDVDGGAGAPWISTLGIGISDAAKHIAFQGGLRATAVHESLGRATPSFVVMDWSQIAEVSADGLAYAAVLHHTLPERGVSVICAPPADASVRVLLAPSLAGPLYGEGVTWLPVSGSASRSGDPMTLLCPLVAFLGSHGRLRAGELLGALESALEAHGWPAIDLISDLVMELAQNVLAHANARIAAICAVLHRRRRPPVLQIGLADGGIGIAASMMEHPRHAWLGLTSEASAVESVYVARMSRRGLEEGGGVLSCILEDLLARYNSRVTVRSGGGHLAVSSAAPHRIVRTSASIGYGTQYLIEIRRPQG